MKNVPFFVLLSIHQHNVLQGDGQVHAEGAEESEHTVEVILHLAQHRQMRRRNKEEEDEGCLRSGEREYGRNKGQLEPNRREGRRLRKIKSA